MGVSPEGPLDGGSGPPSRGWFVSYVASSVVGREEASPFLNSIDRLDPHISKVGLNDAPPPSRGRPSPLAAGVASEINVTGHRPPFGT